MSNIILLLIIMFLGTILFGRGQVVFGVERHLPDWNMCINIEVRK